MSPSSVKLDAMVRDLEETLRRDPTSKFIILTQYPEVIEYFYARMLLYLML